MSKASERYRLIERIGAGGLGVVHRAVDRATDREVAIKIMPRPHGGTNLRDEFVALARLRHPGVVEVYDYGLTDAGHEYFAMELVRGPTLAEAAGPTMTPRWFALLGGVLDTLGFVHGRGMVHADIKPSNILVDATWLEAQPVRAARLCDFGLAAALGDPSTQAARGTVGYAAPEAWAGQLDPRADLYSLGVVLYELLTGALPWTGTTAREIIAAQRRGAPADPRTLVPAVPAVLAELVVAMCDPAPGARPQTVDEVLDRLRQAATACGCAEVVPAAGTPGPRATLDLGGQLIGRDRERAELESAWRDARAGRGTALLLVGEEGIGKSRLLAELVLYAQLDGGEVVQATLGRRTDTPWSGLEEVVRALVVRTGERGPDDSDDGDGDGDGGGGDGPGEVDHGRVDRARRRALAPLLARAAADEIPRWATADAVAELVTVAARGRPLLLALDDLDEASLPATEVLAYLTRAVPDAPVLLVMAARKGDRGRRDDGDRIARLTTAVRGATRGRRIDVPPLDRDATHELAAAAIGSELASRLGDDLARASGGNPGHALRALGLMVRSGTIARVRGAWTADGPLEVPLPSRALSSALERIAELDPTNRAILAAAAVVGSVTVQIVTSVLAAAGAGPDAGPAPGDPGGSAADGELAGHRTRRAADAAGGADRVEAALAEATAARVLAADPAAGVFRFAHDELAVALADELPAERRAALHRAAAAVLDGLAERGAPVVAGELARHHLASGNRTAALRWGRAAAEAAAGAGDPAAALAWCRTVLQLADDAGAPEIEPEVRAAIAERAGDLAAATGDVDFALACYERGAGAGASPESRVRVALAIAELQRRRGDGDAAHRVLMGALGIARGERLTAAEARCHLRIGWVLMYRADYKAANEHAVAGLVIARSTADRRTAAELGRLAAAIAIFQGDTRRALALLEDADAAAEQVGDDRLRAGVLHEIGRAAIHGGDYRRATAALEHAIAAAQAAGDVEQRARSLNNLGAACYFQGDWARARTAWERFRALCERLDEQSEMTNALNNLGSLYRDLGQLADARAALDRAAEVATATGHTHMAAMILANRGEVELRDGDLAGARDRYERALAEFGRIGAREDTIETRRRLSEVDILVGKLDEALSRALDTARDARDAGAKLEEGIVHRVAATALRLQRDLESSEWFLGRARELLGALGARYELAKVDLEAAELARTSGKLADAERLLADAEATFGQLGARWDLERARGVRRSLGAGTVGVRGGAAGSELVRELALAVGTIDLEKVLELALDRLLAASGYERGFVLLLDQDGRPRERLRRSRPGARTFDRGDVEFSGTIVRRVAATGAAAAVGDIADDVDLREQKSVIALGLRRIMCAPLKVGGRVIGIVYVDSAQPAPGAVDDRGLDLAALEALAAPLALAIDHARLVGEDKRKSELMSILAHEIRNPLAGILGYSEMGSEAEARGEAVDVKELLDRIHHDAERLRRLVDNVLELTRHETGNVDWSMTAVDVGQLIDDVTASYKVACERKHLSLRVDADGLKASALGNPDRLAQVLSNLIGNAVKFTPSGGTITVRARREQVRASDPTAPPIPATEIRAWVPGGEDEIVGEFVRIDVADTGPGMTPELRAHLFEKFSQGAGRKRASGIGLGLYISREIVRRHGGSIWVDSDLGKGATFSVRVPTAL